MSSSPFNGHLLHCFLNESTHPFSIRLCFNSLVLSRHSVIHLCCVIQSHAVSACYLLLGYLLIRSSAFCINSFFLFCIASADSGSFSFGFACRSCNAFNFSFLSSSSLGATAYSFTVSSTHDSNASVSLPIAFPLMFFLGLKSAGSILTCICVSWL